MLGTVSSFIVTAAHGAGPVLTIMLKGGTPRLRDARAPPAGCQKLRFKPRQCESVIILHRACYSTCPAWWMQNRKPRPRSPIDASDQEFWDGGGSPPAWASLRMHVVHRQDPWTEASEAQVPAAGVLCARPSRLPALRGQSHFTCEVSGWAGRTRLALRGASIFASAVRSPPKVWSFSRRRPLQGTFWGPLGGHSRVQRTITDGRTEGRGQRSKKRLLV